MDKKEAAGNEPLNRSQEEGEDESDEENMEMPAL